MTFGLRVLAGGREVFGPERPWFYASCPPEADAKANRAGHLSRRSPTEGRSPATPRPLVVCASLNAGWHSIMWNLLHSGRPLHR